jgi:hypothetical protein
MSEFNIINLLSIQFFCQFNELLSISYKVERWQETALLFFSALAFRVGKKINVLFARWLF